MPAGDYSRGHQGYGLDRDALEAHGVDVGESDDGLTEYRNVPPELSLSACHLAVDLRRDPAELLEGPDK